MPIAAPLLQQFQTQLGKHGVLSRPEDLKLYEYDGGVDKALPDVVLFPRSTEDVVFIVQKSIAHNLPIVGRGAGTGLSGGSIPRHGGIIISFSRMNRILDIDIENERVIVQPGVVNLDVTQAVKAHGYFFAPDPSSQKACTIGGNVAENAGGPHTLAYGVTTNHVVSLEAVLADGTVIQLGDKELDLPGYDLIGLLTGSEGTMALITEIGVRLTRAPEVVKTMLAIYSTAEDAGATVGELTAHSITPVAIEMLDGPMLRVVEEATHAGYPMDAAAVLLIEVEGLKETAEEQAVEIEAVCRQCGAREFRVAQDCRRARPALERPQERLWRSRPDYPHLLCSGRCCAAHQDRAHPARHR